MAADIAATLNVILQKVDSKNDRQKIRWMYASYCIGICTGKLNFPHLYNDI